MCTQETDDDLREDKSKWSGTKLAISVSEFLSNHFETVQPSSAWRKLVDRLYSSSTGSELLSLKASDLGNLLGVREHGRRLFLFLHPLSVWNSMQFGARDDSCDWTCTCRI